MARRWVGRGAFTGSFRGMMIEIGVLAVLLAAGALIAAVVTLAL